MTRAVAVVGVVGEGVCLGHNPPRNVTIEFLVGEPNFTVQDKGVITLRCRGIASCGHEAIPVTGSPVFDVSGSPLHCVGDTGRLAPGGDYTVTIGSDILSTT